MPRLRIGLTAKLLMVTASLAAIPLVGVGYVREMEALLIEQQEQNLLAAARAIAAEGHVGLVETFEHPTLGTMRQVGNPVTMDGLRDGTVRLPPPLLGQHTSEVLAEFGYPPDRHLIRHVFRGRNAEKVNFVADAWVKELERLHPGLCEIRGPAPCPFEKVQDQHRVHIWYLVSGVKSLLAALLPLRAKILGDEDVIDVIDVDAQDCA